MVSERLERLRGRLVLFAPVFLGIGIGGYFLLRVEPGRVTWALIAFAVLGLGLLARWIGRRSLSGFGLPVLAVAAVLCGVGVAGWRADRVAAPVLGFRYYGPVEGRIVAVDVSGSDAVRLTLDEVRLDRLRPERVPKRVRVSLHGAQQWIAPTPGMRVAVTAHLSGPEGPVEPNGFDFRRQAWFRGIGAVGYTRVPAMVVAPSERDLPIARLRAGISAAVRAAIPGEAGAFAAAITTGDRAAMGTATVETLRDSNLAHLLAISGLHMGLLVGFVFASLRLGLVLVPGWATRTDIRRIAAAGALVAGGFYLSLSGGAVSTERAFIMVAVMMGGIIAGRRALTLRAVAVAALVLLVLQPESLVEAGFQMSFAATTALVAVFGTLRSFETGRVPKWARPVFAVVLSSLVAGLATAPFSAGIFNRVVHYGLIANVVAVPVMGTLIMPLAVVAALLAPLGLSWIALDLMRWPIEWILWVARWTADLPGAVDTVVVPPGWVLPVIALGGLTTILLRGWGRVLGAAAVAAALVGWTQATRPDILISPSGGLVGAMGADGRGLSKDRGDGFAAENWLANDGDGADQPTGFARAVFTGEEGLRIAEVKGLTVAHLAGRGALDRVGEACAVADFVVVTKTPEGGAPCPVLSEAVLSQTGSMAIWIGNGNARIVTEAQVSGRRPWTMAGRRAGEGARNDEGRGDDASAPLAMYLGLEAPVQ
ncbi:ComEC/Rec2 family competence protein [Maritimibacter sp. DP1N21-5]|uniref:ComEC/Rec2 family competence protein n=1 Tax=Maritimibacter sp. DP1N21-5 TaxID=2836867 RepID=UPI001C47970A|nr:ComEC/Rec2 family competence protein [Maritimibacter sp. DP1N21-5]MBV7410106.1 ComEC family competence protein [Maritimibacter sp. DP1N21-5]